MADPKPTLAARRASEARDKAVPPQRASRPDPDLRAARVKLIEEAERIMGVKPILGPTGMRPTGY